MNHFAMNWFQEEEEKRKSRSSKNDAMMINRLLNRLIIGNWHGMDEAKREIYKRAVSRVERELVSSSLLDLRYLNNLESPKVAVWQYAFLKLLDAKNPELRNIEGRIRNLDFNEWQHIPRIQAELKRTI